MTNSMNAGSDGAAILDAAAKRGIANPAMFFRRWLAQPLQMGSIPFVGRAVPTLTARREAWTPLNFPPASVWRYVPGFI